MSATQLFLEDAYAQEAPASVREITEEGGIILSASLFYPTGGGQPGDGGRLEWDDGEVRIATTVKNGQGDIVLVPHADQALPPPGATVRQVLDWTRRYSHMRVHTALHLLSVALPFGVTGGAISEAKGRLDFDMTDPLEDKDAVARRLNEMIATDAPVTEQWITDAELDARPDLVKTMKVKPPRGAGRVRLVRIGSDTAVIDLQPCGGTHVKSLSEIGPVRLGKVEKKGRSNRRVYLHLEA